MSLTLLGLELRRVGPLGFAAVAAWGGWGLQVTQWVPETHRALLYALGGVAAVSFVAAQLRAAEPTRALNTWLASLPISPREVALARSNAVALAAVLLVCGALSAGQAPLASGAWGLLAWGAALILAPWRVLSAPLLVAGALIANELSMRFDPRAVSAAAGFSGLLLGGWALARATLQDPARGALQGLVHPSTRRPFKRHAWTLAVLLAIALVVRRAAPVANEPVFVGASVTLLHSGVSLRAPAAVLGEVRTLAPELQHVPTAVAALLGCEAPPPVAYRVAPKATPPTPGFLHLDAGVSPARQVAEQTARALLEVRLGELPALDSRILLREGLVRYATWRVTDGDSLPSRTHAAVAHARRPFALDELYDLNALDATRGVQVAGTVGEVWVACLVAERGDAVIPELIAAAKPGVRWPLVFTRLQIDRDALEQAVLQAIEAVADEPRAQADLPRLIVLDDAAEHPELQVVVVPDRAVPPGWEVFLRSRYPGEPLVDALPLGSSVAGSHRFHVPGAPVFGARPALQIGLRARRSGDFPETVWEEWAFAPNNGF